MTAQTSFAAGVISQEQARAQEVTSALKGADKKDLAHIQAAAQKFESYMLGYVFKNMQGTISQSELFGHSDHREMFMGMYVDEVTKQNHGLGLADMIVKQYKQTMGDEQAPNNSLLKTRS